MNSDVSFRSRRSAIVVAAGVLLVAVVAAVAWQNLRLPPVSDTAPSEDARILQASATMSDGAAVLPHQTTTINTGETLVSYGAVGGMSADRFSNIFSTNFADSVWRIATDGTTTLLSDKFTAASGNYALANGDLLQSDYVENRIYRVKPNGSRTVFTDVGLDGPVGLVQRPSGDFIVANYRGGFLASVPADGGDATIVLDDERLGGANGVTIDADGNIYIADLKSPIVFRWAPDGTLHEHAELPGKGNAHNVVANGALYVNKIWDHVIYRVELDSGAYGIVSGNGRAGYDDGLTGVSTIEEPNGIAASTDGQTVYFNTHRGAMYDTPSYIVLRELTEAP